MLESAWFQKHTIDQTREGGAELMSWTVSISRGRHAGAAGTTVHEHARRGGDLAPGIYRSLLTKLYKRGEVSTIPFRLRRSRPCAGEGERARYAEFPRLYAREQY